MEREAQSKLGRALKYFPLPFNLNLRSGVSAPAGVTSPRNLFSGYTVPQTRSVAQMPDRNQKQVLRLLGALTAAIVLSSCSTPATNHARPTFVRTLDFSAAPQMKEQAERARAIANEMYPTVCALLADGHSDFPQQFDICFKQKLSKGHSGETRMTRI